MNICLIWGKERYIQKQKRVESFGKIGLGWKLLNEMFKYNELQTYYIVSSKFHEGVSQSSFIDGIGLKEASLYVKSRKSDMVGRILSKSYRVFGTLDGSLVLL